MIPYAIIPLAMLAWCGDELSRFPPREDVCAMCSYLEFTRDYSRALATMVPTRTAEAELLERANHANEVLTAWCHLRAARRWGLLPEPVDPWCCIQELEDLRSIIGDDAYWRGAMPIPRWAQ